MTAKQAELAARFGVEPIYTPDESFPPPELFPKKMGWLVREEDGTRRLDIMRWGFPHRVKGASGKMLDTPVTNVRNLNSPFWKSVLKTPERRCLVPVTDFCEMAGEPGTMKSIGSACQAAPSSPLPASGDQRPMATSLLFLRASPTRS